jgi:uncharacterized repeat protein (TIGR01451 family)
MTAQRPIYRLIKATAIVGLGLTMVCGLLFLFGRLASPATAAPLAVIVNADITTDTTWTTAGSPYIVATNTVAVRNGAKLTIEPGVEVRFSAGAQLQIRTSGYLEAIGTPTQPITFTSDLMTPAPGDWDGIRFETDALTGTIQYVTIEYAEVGVSLNRSAQYYNVSSNTFRYIGGASNSSAIIGTPDDSDLSYNTIYSSVVGFRLDEAGDNVLRGNHIYDIDDDCIAFLPGGVPSAGNQIINNQIHDCGSRGVSLDGGFGGGGSDNQIIGNQIWNITNEAVDVYNQGALVFSANTVYSAALINTVGAVVFERTDMPTIQNNYLYDNGSTGLYEGALVIQNSDPSPVLITFVGLNDTRIRDNYGSGLVFRGAITYQLQTINSNAICVVDRYELANQSTNGFSLNAAGNWLGTNFPLIGTEITGTVTYSPYIRLIPLPDPTILPADGLSTAVITVTMNDGAGHTVPSGARQVNLTTSLGSLADTSLTLNGSGVATTTLRSAPTIGTAVITVTEWCGYAVTITVEFQATDVAVSKSSTLTEVIPGQTITYTIQYSNNTAVPATNVVITDTLPAGTEWVSDDALGQGFSRSFSGQDVIWTRPSLGGNVNGAITLVARLPQTATTSCGLLLTNNVVITTTTLESNTSNNSASVGGVQVVCADVGIRKTSTLTQVVGGSTVTYTVVYSNAGTAVANNVVITDTLPPGMGYVSDTSGLPVTVGTGVITWQVGPLNSGGAGSTFNLVLSTTMASCGTGLTNIAGIRTTTPESNTNNNSSSAGGINVACADVTLTKVGPSGNIVAGTAITYTLYYTNVGTTPAVNVVITDVHPITGGVDTLLSGATLNPGQGGNLSYPVFVGLGLCSMGPTPAITNTAYIGASTPESNTANNRSSVTNLVQCLPDLVITKTRVSTPTSLGRPITFTIEYANTGVYTAPGTVITDLLPPGVSYLTDTFTLGPPVTTTSTVAWSLGNLGPGANGSFSVSLRFDISACSGTASFTNTAQIGSTWSDANNADNVDYEGSGPIPCDTDLVVVKNDGVGGPSQRPVVLAGDLITYTITYLNAGGQATTGVVLTETLPAYTTFVGPTGPNGWYQVGATSLYTYYIGTLDAKTGDKLNFVVRVAPALPATVTVVNNEIRIDGDEADAYPDDNVSYEQTPVQTVPDLMVQKASLTLVAHPGDLVTYLITVTNQGSVTATNVFITDTLPTSTTYQSNTVIGAPVISTASTVVWDVGQFAPGQTTSFNLTVRVDSDTSICSQSYLINTVEVRGVEAEGDYTNNIASTTATNSPAVACYDIAISKSVDMPQTAPDRDVVFTLTYGNPGLITVTNTVITDVLPVDISFVQSTPVHSGPFGNVYQWSVSSLAPGVTGTIVITSHVSNNPALCDQTLTNTAGITASFVAGDDEYLGNNQAAATVTVRCVPDLVVGKNDRVGGPTEPPFVQVGEVFTYSILYSNVGVGAAHGVVLTETLPNHTAFVGPVGPNGWTQVGATNQYTYSLGTVNAGAGLQVEFAVRVVTIPPGGFITNTVCISGLETEVTLSNNCSFEQTLVTTNTPRLNVFKSAIPPSGSNVVVGQTITYTIVVLNDGQATADNVLITDTLPLTEVSFITATLSNGGPIYGPNPLTTTVATLPVNSAVTMTVVVTVNNVVTGTIITNTAQAVANTLPVQFSPSVTHVVTALPAVAIKQANPASGRLVNRGDLITYTISVTNQDITQLTGVVITDYLPISVTFVSSSTSQGSVSGPNPLVVNVGTLSAGARATFTFTVRVTDTAPNGLVITNTAQIDSDQTTISNTNLVTHVVDLMPDLGVEKVALASIAHAGDQVTYLITVTNQGNYTATNVVITDTLPNFTSYVTNTIIGSPLVTLTNQLTWSVGSLAPSQVLSFELTLQTNNPLNCLFPPLTNTVAAFGAETDFNTSDNVATTTLPDIMCNDVGITKSVNTPLTTPDQDVVFTLVYANPGIYTATNVVVTDTLPTGINFVASTPPVSGPVGGVYSWTIGSLSASVTRTIVITGHVNASVACDSVLTNTAGITTTSTDDNALNDFATATVTVRCGIDMAVFKNDGVGGPTEPPYVQPGDVITYSIAYLNLGTGNATNVVITETLPNHTSFEGPTGLNGWFQVGATNDYTYNLGTVYTGTGSVVNFAVRVLTVPGGGFITNTVCIGSGQSDVVPGNNCSFEQTLVTTNVARLNVSKSAVPPSGAAVQPGQTITYTVVVLNDGSATANNVLITDTLPLTEVSFITATLSNGGPVYGPNPLTATVVTLPVNSAVTMTVVVTVNNVVTGTLITNTAQAVANTLPVQSSLPVTHVVTGTILVPNLVISKTASPPSGSIVEFGDWITYTITVQNNGPGSVSNVVISDTLDANVTLVTSNTITGTLSGPNPVRVSIPTLNVSQSVTVTLGVTVASNVSGTIITNRASVSSTQTPLPQVSGVVTHVISGAVVVSPNLTFVKSAVPPSGTPVSPGDTITYTIVVSNSGVPATNVVLGDTIPSGTGYVSGSFTSTLGSLNFVGNQLMVNVPSFSTGVTMTATFRVTVTTNLTTTISNFALLDSDQTTLTSSNVVTHPVLGIGTLNVYLPLILKDYTGPSASLSWIAQDQDRVREVDGSNSLAFTPDGRNDGAFQLTVNVGSAASKTVANVRLLSSQGASVEWDTIVNTRPVLGIFNGGTRLNNADGTINQVVSGQIIVTLYASDDTSGSTQRFPPDTYDYTVIVTFTDGSSVLATARIPPLPPLPNDYCDVVAEIIVGNTPRGVAVDSTRNRVYVANYGSSSVSVINSSSNTVLQTISGITSANGIVHDWTNNIIWVTNYSSDQVTPIQADASATNFTVLEPIPVRGGPWGVAYDQVHNYVYVVNNLGNSVTVINAGTRNVVAVLSGSFSQPYHVAANPVTGKVYVTNFGNHTVTVLNGAAVSSVVNLNVEDPSTQPYGIAVDETREVIYVATVDSHRVVAIGVKEIDGALVPDQLLGWAAFHRGYFNPPPPHRPVPMRAIAVNPDIGSIPPNMDDGGHVWTTTSTSDGSEADQALLIPKGWISYFHSPVPCNVRINPTEGIAIDRNLDRAYVTSGTNPGRLAVITDPSTPPLVPFSMEEDGDDNEITFEVVIIE